MKKRKSFVFGLLLLVVWGCNNDNEPEVTTGVVLGKVTDASSDAALEGVRIIVLESNSNTPIKSLTTDADGMYKTDLQAGSYYLKLYRNGYNQVPPKGMSPLPFAVAIGVEHTNAYKMNPSVVQNGGFVSGKVSDGAQAVAGVLVVAEKDGVAFSAITDAAGDFFIFNLQAGSYTLKAWVAGYKSDEHMVSVSESAESKKNLNLTKGAEGTVTGTVTFLASNAKEVDITLVHPKTGEAIPGLLSRSSANYSIAQVPVGTYLARASFENDERVVDPDWIIKNGEPFVTVNSGSVSRNFSLTGSLKLVAPTNETSTTEPKLVNTLNPKFSWAAYSSASDYVVEVSDANGNIIWGGFEQGASGLEKKVSVPSSQTEIVFNSDQTAASPLIPGNVYRWKVYASKDDAKEPNGWKLISVSEDQMGLIQVAN